MLKKEAKEITGGLSRPGKMPGPSYNLPAPMCITGAKLAKIAGTVCYGCYALKFRYNFRNVKAALARRIASLTHQRWVDAMVTLITGHEYFRWHDSGDLQGPHHLKNIFEVCKRTPRSWHWLPTREAKLLQFLDPDVIPKNLLIRVSGTKVNGPAPSWWPWTSTVSTTTKTCPAPDQGGKCRSCRACWSRDVKNVTYAKH
jgi:hypothetical protein